MANLFPGLSVEVKGEDLSDALERSNILKHLEAIATTEELRKIKQLSSEKGRKALKSKWPIISKFC